MFVVHATKKLLDRCRRPATTPYPCTTRLGAWYATAIFSRPQLALFVNEATLLPVLAALAPAKDVIDRFPDALSTTLSAHAIERWFIDRELVEMTEYRMARTASRSVVGVMNDFVRLTRHASSPTGELDVVGLSLWLAQVPCGPLAGRHVSPDRELRAVVDETSAR